MVAPSRLMGKQPQADCVDSDAHPVRRTWISNATAHPGLPDKLAPRHTAGQMQADNEVTQRAKDAKKVAIEAAYQRISTMEDQMAAIETTQKPVKGTLGNRRSKGYWPTTCDGQEHSSGVNEVENQEN